MKRLSAAALEVLMGHDWPGNVRELRHAVERAVIFSDGVAFEPKDFSLATGRAHPPAGPGADDASLDDVEKNTIARALAESTGKMSARAAQALGVTRASLYRRKEKYGL